ncbi:MAG: putative nucleotidyltransferase substrate binding domain-containing protein [Acidobacteriota bacterium]
MDTSAISYRVADFLKQHPPFHAMEEADLLALAAHGRVRFYEANEFILWQGEPHKLHVFVIQQGTVLLWDESGGHAELRDVRGAGDLLDVGQFNGTGACVYSARSATDVVVYGFPATDFEAFVLKYPYARDYIAGFDRVTADFQRTDQRSDPPRMFLNEVTGPLQICRPQDSVADVARIMVHTGSDAVAVVDAEAQLVGLLTSNALLTWIADGGGNSQRPVSDLQTAAPPIVGPEASITDGVIAMGAAGTNAVAMTTDGTAAGRLLSVVTPHHLARAFGDQPAAILADIRRADDFQALRSLNQRARACAHRHLTDAASTDWIVRFTELVDHEIITRILALVDQSNSAGCWCVCGTSGRGESVTKRQPHVILVHDELIPDWNPWESYTRVIEGLTACDYLPGFETPFEAAFYVASVDEWSRRYEAWILYPVLAQMARSRPLFDLRPIHGPRALWEQIRVRVAQAVDGDIVRVLAHDCLASLPPLTFFQETVVDESGEQTSVFRLEHNALQPLVDVGRVFGMAARRVMGTSTLDRFAIARGLLPAHEAIFREASQALRVVLWQQGRIGISQGTTSSELPPALLSRHDRHMLKSGFPAILRLLEFTADPAWLDAL